MISSYKKLKNKTNKTNKNSKQNKTKKLKQKTEQNKIKNNKPLGHEHIFYFFPHMQMKIVTKILRATNSR